MIQFYWDFAKIWKQKFCNIMKSFVIHCNAFFTRLTEILEKNSYSWLDKTVDYWLVNEFSVQNQGTRLVFTYCHKGSLCCYTLYMSNSNINLKALCIPHGEERTKFLREKKLKYWILKLFYLTTSSLKTYFFINRILYPITGDVTSILYRYSSDNTHQIQKNELQQNKRNIEN